MDCTHAGYFKISVSAEQKLVKQLAVDTVKQVQFLRDRTVRFSTDDTLHDKLVTFEVVAGCSICGIVPERKVLKIQNGEIVEDLQQVVTI
jgi:hypothetical protein